jgi:phage major head subunit gpT-like protein
MAGTGNFADLLAPGFRQIFMNKFAQYAEQYSSVFNTDSSTRAYEDDSFVSGFGLAPVKGQGQGISYADPKQGFDKRYTHVTYGLGYFVTRELFDDDQYGKINRLPRSLARSMRATVETVAANVLNRAFDSTYTGGDAKELCATDHPLVGGGTQKNELTTAADLDATSFEQALIDIGDTTDDEGILLALRPMKLIVPSELDWAASTLLYSSLDPDSANNAINPAKGRMPYMVYNWLTDPDAWFILCEDHELNFLWRRKIDFTKDNDFDTENARFKSTMRFSVGWSIPWGVFGSPGV